MSSSVKNILARRVFVSMSFVMVCAALEASAVENTAARVAALSTFATAPLYFEKNAGQLEQSAPFIARGAECSVLLAPTEAQILLGKSPGQIAVPNANATRAVRLQLLGANSAAQIAGLDEMPAKANYFIGNEPAKWHTGVPLFSKVRVDEVYPGVQVIYYANQSAQLEYDFLLRPGARADQIQFHITGADSVRVDDIGNLVLTISGQEIRQHKPVAYQMRGSLRIEIQSGYSLKADGTVGFALAAYDRTLPLVIDPVLDFLTYIGGKKLEVGWGITIDPAGNTYVTGETLSTGLSTTNSIQYGATNFSRFRGGNNAFGDAFVAKYDATGALGFLTYLGGKNDDGGLAIDFDSSGSGSVWVTGFTDSTNFPLQNPIRARLTGLNKNAKHIFPVDAFITKLDSSGTSILFSTYFGADGIEEGTGIRVHGGDVFVTGFTSSVNLPVIPVNAFQRVLRGNFDAFVTRLASTGGETYTNVYTTYLGGTNIDYGLSVDVDSGEDAWVTGLTYSTNFYTTNALQLPPGVSAFFPDGHTFTNLNTQTNSPRHDTAFRNNAFHSDAFVTELSPDGTSSPFSTFLGGTNDEVGERIVVDNADNVYVAGYTLSRDFPTNVITVPTTNTFGLTNVIFPNVATNFLAHPFVTEISGHALAYSTHFGGNAGDVGTGLAVDGNGLVYVSGSVSSTNFYATNMLVYTNIDFVVDRHGRTNLVYLGTFTNNPVFTNLSATNATVQLKRRGNNTNDVFVAVLAPGLGSFMQSILLGGPGRDDSHGIVVDSAGNAAYIVGTTTSTTNFVTTNAAQQGFGGGKKSRLSDAFVSKIQIIPSP